MNRGRVILRLVILNFLLAMLIWFYFVVPIPLLPSPVDKLNFAITSDELLPPLTPQRQGPIMEHKVPQAPQRELQLRTGDLNRAQKTSAAMAVVSRECVPRQRKGPAADNITEHKVS